jgi:hypothetical protein
MPKELKPLPSEYLKIVAQFSGEDPLPTEMLEPDTNHGMIAPRFNVLPPAVRGTRQSVDVIGDVDTFINYVEKGDALKDWKDRVEARRWKLDQVYPPLGAADSAEAQGFQTAFECSSTCVRNVVIRQTSVIASDQIRHHTPTFAKLLLCIKRSGCRMIDVPWRGFNVSVGIKIRSVVNTLLKDLPA